MLIQPSRSTFWRWVFTISAFLASLSVWQLYSLAGELGIDLSSSKSWQGILAFLSAAGVFALVALALSCSKWGENFLLRIDSWGTKSSLHWFGIPLLVIGFIGFSIIFTVPLSRDLFGGQGWIRAFIFWTFSLLGLMGVKLYQKGLPWFISLLVVMLSQSFVHLLVTQFSGITDYPFSMGWSETSRYYYPSLFLSETIYGNRLPWPILHPSLHLMLVPPYLFDAPLWLHRFWQFGLRFVLLGLTASVLVSKLSIRKRNLRLLLWGWMLLYLYQGPIYMHLTIPLVLVLWGYYEKDDRRTWIVILLASIWAGLSRINWYPFPGLLAAILYFLGTPYQDKKLWRYLSKPALWFIAGTAAAFATQRLYILFSGIPNPEFFYTSLSSNQLWYRLWPNASYSLGVFPAALLASLPMWAVIFITVRPERNSIHNLRLALIGAVLLVFFGGGILVSMKIGGGVDIHNLDVYLVTLLVVASYLAFGRYVPDEEDQSNPVKLHWGWAVLLVLVPAYFTLQFNSGFASFDKARTQAVLSEIEALIQNADAQGQEVLFITQRHLIATHMIDEVNFVPEYEREELMEMAMGNNREYLQVFREDMEKQRFDLIVVDPLSFRLLGSNYPFGEENNAWVQRIMKPILCNYQEEVVFPKDQIAIYAPQTGTRKCP